MRRRISNVDVMPTGGEYRPENPNGICSLLNSENELISGHVVIRVLPEGFPDVDSVERMVIETEPNVGSLPGAQRITNGPWTEEELASQYPQEAEWLYRATWIDDSEEVVSGWQNEIPDGVTVIETNNIPHGWAGAYELF